ncbi:MAG: TRASH domain-containing protein [Verrucomicrobia bacterium]|nr:TRASH domain-containing protein [Verrucomicrobiota bacterium]
MKALKVLTVAVLTTAFLAGPLTLLAGDAKSDKKAEKPKPYPLKTCIVTDEKLGGDMGDPYVFTHEEREVKLCCKSCLKDFKKAPAKFIKKIEEAEKKPKK